MHNLPNFRQYCNAVGIKRVQYWPQNRCIYQWNRIESPEINPQTYSQLIFDTRGKNIQWGKDSLFSKWLWESWPATYKSMKLEHPFTTYKKINLKWLRDINKDVMP